MLAIDTNVVIRYLTQDNPRQSLRARALVDNQDVFVATTVLLETEWVLRSVYGRKPHELVHAFAQFAGLPHVHLQDPLLLARALDCARAGMDFADALHLAAGPASGAFVSFDEKFVKTAKSLGANVRLP
jgi:predicted nucleic-acid-binding protein